MAAADHPLVQQRVEVIRSELERLEQHLQGLPPEGWLAQTPCPAWNVGDVVAHLYWNAGIYLDRISAGLRGDGPPERWNAPPRSGRPAKPLMEFVAEKAVSLHQEMGDRLLPDFVEKHRELIDLFSSVKPGEWDRPCYFIPPAPVPVSYFVGLRIAELGVHSWDIRVAADAGAGFAADALPALVEPARRQVERSQPSSDSNARYRFELTGPGAETLDIVIRDGATAIEAPQAATPDVTLGCDTATFVVLMYGRKPLEDATATGEVSIDGDEAAAGALGRWLIGV